jgi:hypothetical protein
VSFDVYVQFFRAGQESCIAEDVVRAAFPGLVEVLDDDYWLLRFGADETTDLFLGLATPDPHAVHSLSFHRPGVDARLWDGIWELLATPGALFHFPGGGPAQVRDAGSVVHVPAGRQEGFGGIGIAPNVATLRAMIEAAQQL